MMMWTWPFRRCWRDSLTHRNSYSGILVGEERGRGGRGGGRGKRKGRGKGKGRWTGKKREGRRKEEKDVRMKCGGGGSD